MNRTQIYLDEEQTARLDQKATGRGAPWRAQWRKALEGSAGQAPYLEDGAEYVEGIRSAKGLRAPY